MFSELDHFHLMIGRLVVEHNKMINWWLKITNDKLIVENNKEKPGNPLQYSDQHRSKNSMMKIPENTRMILD